MDIVEGIINFANLPLKEQALVISTLHALQENSGVESERYVPMDEEIKEDSARAKEYFKRSHCTVPTWIYSSINWKQVYKTLVKNGLLVEKDGSLYMKLKDYGR